MADPQDTEKAVRYERGMSFWFSSRQPRYMENYVTLWGEFFDDEFRASDEQGGSDDL